MIKEFFISIFLFLLLSSIVLYSFNFLPNIHSVPSVGVSECIKHNETYNPLNLTDCKVYPGSLLIVTEKTNPFGFKYRDTKNPFDYLVPFAVVILIALSASVSYYISFGKNEYKYHLLFLLVGIVITYFILLFSGSSFTKGDIICFKHNNDVICHTLINYNDSLFYLKGTNSNWVAKVTNTGVLGKVVCRVPAYGALIYSVESGVETLIKMFDIIIKGYYPERITITYYRW